MKFLADATVVGHNDPTAANDESAQGGSVATEGLVQKPGIQYRKQWDLIISFQQHTLHRGGRRNLLSWWSVDQTWFTDIAGTITYCS